MDATGGHSPDREWWWSGSTWLPAWSVDRRWWFDGVSWQAQSLPAERRPSWWTRAKVAWGALWLVTMVLQSIGVAIDPTLTVRQQTIAFVIFLALNAAWFIGLTATGFALALRSNWRYLRLSVAWVAGLALGWYAFAMVTAPGSGSDGDWALEVVVGAVCALLLVAFATSIGAGVGVFVRRQSRQVRAKPLIYLSLMASGLLLTVLFAWGGVLSEQGGVDEAPLVSVPLFGMAIASFAGLVLLPLAGWAVAAPRHGPADLRV